MRILLLNQFYPPDDAPTGRMLHDLGRVLVSRGHEVHVVCSRLSYDGRARWKAADVVDGVKVERTGGVRFRRGVVGRLLAYAIFLGGAFRTAMTAPAPDTVLSLTTPPFLSLAGRLVAKLRKSRHAHWAMDLYPDALFAHWSGARCAGVRTALEWLGRAQFGQAAVIIAPGAGVEKRLLRYAPATARRCTVPLWAADGLDRLAPGAVAQERLARGWRAEDLVLMYSGNMGLGHTFSEFLAAAQRLGAEGPIWAFIGDGPRRKEIARFRTENPVARVQLLPYVDVSHLAASLASADVHLVSVATGWDGVMVPSKLQNVFAVARPVIFLGPATSEVATWVRDSGGGWVVPTGDVDGLLRAIEHARQPAERLRRGEAARAYSRVHFDRQTNTTQIAETLEACVTERES